MNLKKIAAAITIGLASMSAFADPVGSVTGDVEIKLGGLTTETMLTAGTNESTWGVVLQPVEVDFGHRRRLPVLHDLRHRRHEHHPTSGRRL